ncbi:signal transduction histidine kinase [Methanohalophilus levihalophilus]|uniref:hypothetical protein n=1 Tax=Methanohalophilus levihalophilus TaxID=1431282 RepID=UPI001AE33EEC|nr:hypothetical protein [Methanohalophilus levihalophilus]MBP2031122.1 signal transduction histidine kinase [Methanohalophilus levihalophilus]
MDRENSEKLKMTVFVGKFLLYLTILFLLGIPAIRAYILSPDHALNAFDFFTFYLPLNLVPFIALILATPIENRKRLRLIAIGSAVIFLFTVTIIALQFNFASVTSELFYVYAIGRAAFPFVLWFAFMHKDLNFFNL